MFKKRPKSFIDNCMFKKQQLIIIDMIHRHSSDSQQIEYYSADV